MVSTVHENSFASLIQTVAVVRVALMVHVMMMICHVRPLKVMLNAAMIYAAMVPSANTLMYPAVVVQANPMSCVHCASWMISAITVDAHTLIMDLHCMMIFYRDEGSRA